MDLNNNSIPLKNCNSVHSVQVKVSFTNEIQLDMQLPNSKPVFNKFNQKEFKPFVPQTESSQMDRRSSFVESAQNQQLDCYGQFDHLIRNEFNRLGVDFDGKLKKFKLDPHLDDTSQLQLKNKHMTTFELDAYVFGLIVFTENKLKQLSDLSNQDSTNNLNPEIDKSIELKEKSDLIDYFKILSFEKLVVYKNKLDQTIKKLNDDLLDLLEERDLIYLKRDELFKQCESLTRSSLQAIDDFDDNPTV